MKHFYLKTLLLCLSLLAGTSAFAYDCAVNGIYYDLDKSNKTASVTYKVNNENNKNAYHYSVVIPSSIQYGGDTYSVTSIGNYAFNYCRGLTSVIIPNSVTSIGESAFRYCSGLTSVIIPNSVTSIGESAFKGCSGLTSVTIPNSVTSIGESAFYGCSGLTSVIIPNSVTSIGEYAFYGCSGLTSITIPNSVTSIEGAFYGCRGLTSVIIPNSVTSIGGGAFYGCSGLTSVTIPNSVTSIGESAFKGCSGLTSITIPNSVTSIGEDAFQNCSGLTSITIPNSVTSIGNYAFSGCSGLTSVIIPNSVTSIGESAFYGCSGLTSVIIPNSVTSIGKYAFYGCSGLTNVTINSNDVLSKYEMLSIFDTQVKEYIIGGGVTSIGAFAFKGCSGLTSVTIPNSVTTIGVRAFYGCSGLTNVTIPSSVTSIGGDSFYGCGLEKVTLPDNIVSIGYGAFPYSTKIYVNRGSNTLLSLWAFNRYQDLYNNWSVFDISSGKELVRPSLAYEATQTTLTLQINNKYDEYGYSYGQSRYSNTGNLIVSGDCINITDLYPESDIMYCLYASINGGSEYLISDIVAKTAKISPSINEQMITASSITAKGIYTKGDATVSDEQMCIGRETVNGNMLSINGLEPDKDYSVWYTFKVNGREYKAGRTFTTQALTLTTQQPKVISPGNVIVAAQSNLDDEETNVGFEWRRTDWTDDFTSNSGTAYLYEGQMEGYIRNLNTEKLWKFRPYYESAAGNRYYGEWVGLDPTNTSYFEPTVHTYAWCNVQGNEAEVKGYAMRGSDNITEQGFMYWAQGAASSRQAVTGKKHAPAVPDDATTVKATGNVMQAKLKGLSFETTYCYVAYVKTSEGETFYGDERQFTTGVDTSGIDDVVAAPTSATAVAYYDLKGRRLESPQKGLVIIRMSDGTVRKVMMK